MVRFPVDAFLSRIKRLAEDTAATLEVAAASSSLSLPGLVSSSTSSSDNTQWASICSLPPSEVLAAVQHTLFKSAQQQQPQGGKHAHDSSASKPSTQPAASTWYSGIKSMGYQVPAYGRSNLPQQSVLDHPGVWEDARMAYLNEVLVRKRGCPAALVILYCEVCRQLLLMGAIDFAVTFDYG